MEAGDRRRRLISEAIATIPSYMTLDDTQRGNLVGSFANIFKSVFSSLKLLGNTLILNLNVVQAAFTNDQAKIKSAFAKFKEKRADYDEEMRDNLKYFRKFYEGEDEPLGGFGPRVLAFAVNPMLPFMVSGPSKPQKASDEGEGEDKTKAKTKTKQTTPAAGGYTPRVNNALTFFGYNASNLSEQKVPATGAVPEVSPEVRAEVNKIQAIAKKFVDGEKANAQEILKQLGNKPAALKKIVESKNFDELESALKQAESAGLKLYTKNISSVKKSVYDDLQKKQKENPEEFSKAILKLKKEFPDLVAKDDVEFAATVAFGTVKSQIQQQLIALYNQFISSAFEAMKLPVDQQTRSKLSQSRLGVEYLNTLDDFAMKIELGAQEVKRMTKV